MIASQADMPVLCFLDGDEEFMNKVSKAEIRTWLYLVVWLVPPILLPYREQRFS